MQQNRETFLQDVFVAHSDVMAEKESKRRSPTWREVLLGGELRRAREDAGLSTQETADRFSTSKSRISKIEHAMIGISLEETERLLDLYGTPEPRRSFCLNLAADSGRQDYWAPYAPVLTSPHVHLEELATEILTWENALIPGLLQTVGYMRETLRAMVPDIDDHELDVRIRLRSARQLLLQRENPPRLTAVIDEAILARGNAGNPAMMKEQVRALLAQPENVTVCLLPTKAGLHAGLDGPFSILRFAEVPAKAYVEGAAGGNHVEGVQDVARLEKAFATLMEKALSPADSRQLLSEYA